MEDITKIVNSGLLLKRVIETVQNEVKEQKGGFLSILLGILSASLLGNILSGRGLNRASEGRVINRAGEGIAKAGYGNKNNKKHF